MTVSERICIGLLHDPFAAALDHDRCRTFFLPTGANGRKIVFLTELKQYVQYEAIRFMRKTEEGAFS